MSQRKSHIVKSSISIGANYSIMPAQSVTDFNIRVTNTMKSVNRDFQKKQKISIEKASNIVLNG
ncbi:hypothetical protein [Tenacibaculum ascidiaceicola]|uniref:hypothetical protein n=1 Tax=Tenacibaculum ascidiaceicola TaxID=1699411 RepID=UPI0038961C98